MRKPFIEETGYEQTVIEQERNYVPRGDSVKR